MSLELDDETLEALGGGDHWGVVTFDLDRARRYDLASRAIANLEYQKTENYRVAHRTASLAYYHANKSRPGARVRGAVNRDAHLLACAKYRAKRRNAAQSPETGQGATNAARPVNEAPNAADGQGEAL